MCICVITTGGLPSLQSEFADCVWQTDQSSHPHTEGSGSHYAARAGKSICQPPASNQSLRTLIFFFKRQVINLANF